jgi:hypothetical protein
MDHFTALAFEASFDDAPRGGRVVRSLALTHLKGMRRVVHSRRTMAVSREGAAMTKDIKSRVARWGAIAAGALVAIKTVIFVVKRIFRFTRSEVNARGSDVNFVLGVAERRRAGV